MKSAPAIRIGRMNAKTSIDAATGRRLAIELAPAPFFRLPPRERSAREKRCFRNSNHSKIIELNGEGVRPMRLVSERSAFFSYEIYFQEI